MLTSICLYPLGSQFNNLQYLIGIGKINFVLHRYLDRRKYVMLVYSDS